MATSFNDQFLRNEKNGETDGNSEPEIIILTNGKGFVEKTDLREQGLFHHNRRRADGAEGKAFLKNPARILRVLEHGVDPFPLSNPNLIGIAKRIMWILIQKGNLDF
jgi:hypothetical protein